MAQNIYDDPEFFAGYSRLPRQVCGLAGAPEWPTVAAMLPPVDGMRVADLGCGFGWASRWFREHGARSVLAIDVSHNMLARARADTDDDGIEYRSADLETIELPAASFDLVYSSLTFHYIRDFQRLIRAIYTSLEPGGDLVFTIEHPIYMAPREPRWVHDEHGAVSWPVDSYSREGERRTNWFTDGVLKHHRTIATTLNTLIAAGFAVRRVEEFAPSPAQVEKDPSLAVEVERPMILCVSAGK